MIQIEHSVNGENIYASVGDVVCFFIDSRTLEIIEEFKVSIIDPDYHYRKEPNREFDPPIPLYKKDYLDICESYSCTLTY